jgi:hypothetical protein
VTQVAAAGILVVNGVTIDFVTNYFGGRRSCSSPRRRRSLLTLLWVVGFTNAFNFIDGLDGLSSGIAAIASLSLLAVALQFPDRGASLLLLAAVAGSALGFLRHNSNPATIHMGDSGAYFLGYLLAAVSVLGALKVTAAVTVVGADPGPGAAGGQHHPGHAAAPAPRPEPGAGVERPPARPAARALGQPAGRRLPAVGRDAGVRRARHADLRDARLAGDGDDRRLRRAPRRRHRCVGARSGAARR